MYPGPHLPWPSRVPDELRPLAIGGHMLFVHTGVPVLRYTGVEVAYIIHLLS